MTYVSKGCKELKTSYTDDTAEVGKAMQLTPSKSCKVLRRNGVGIG